MTILTNKSSLLLILCAIVLLDLLVLAININRNTGSGKANVTESIASATLQAENKLPQDQDYLSNRINEVGAIKAYEEFKHAYAGLDNTIQHRGAHIFGQLLFEKEGINGVTVCDATFSFGCFHSFFGTAIMQEGIDVIHKLDKACIQKYGSVSTGCQHGIGHGLVEHLGSKKEKLEEALLHCASLTWKGKLLGCQSGVFMEYYFPLADRENAILMTRPMEPEPCPTVPVRFQQACYYDTAKWWDELYKHDYNKVGVLCSEVNTKENREACFLGLGDEIGTTNKYDVAKSIQSCKEMPNREGEIFCRAGASYSFFAFPQNRNRESELCEGLTEEENITCLQEAKLLER